jgi:hypothetical protein
VAYKYVISDQFVAPAHEPAVSAAAAAVPLLRAGSFVEAPEEIQRRLQVFALKFTVFILFYIFPIRIRVCFRLIINFLQLQAELEQQRAAKQKAKKRAFA